MNFNAIMKSRWLDLLKRTFRGWMDHRAPRLSAALAYYSIFSIAPLLVITIGLLGLVFGEQAVSGRLYGELSGYMGPQSAEAIQSMVQSASKPTQGVVATVIGLMLLILGASRVFGELKEALNTIWDVKPKPGVGIFGLVRGQFLNFGMVLVIGFLLLVSLVMSTAIAALNQRLESVLPLPAFVWAGAAFVISLGLVTTLFALIFKVLPDAQIRWRHVWFGALITALLFEVGKTGLSWYLGREGTASAFGAAGSVVLLLLWVYYTSSILFFGAEFTQVYADADDCVNEPAVYALRVTAGVRALQGSISAVLPDQRDLPLTAHAMEQMAPPAFSHRLAKYRNNEELRRQALSALAEGRAEISVEVQRLRQQLSPVRVLRRVVDRHTGLVVFLAFTAGIAPVLLVFRNKRSRGRERPAVMTSVAKPPPKPVRGALLLGTLGVLARTITPALIKSVIIPQALKFLAKKQPDLPIHPDPL